MINLLLPIFFHTDNSAQLKDCGVDYNLEECDVRYMYFFEITAIAEFIEDSTQAKYTSIFASGNEFICALEVTEVLVKIRKSNLND